MVLRKFKVFEFHTSFSQPHKISNIAIIADFVSPYI